MVYNPFIHGIMKYFCFLAEITKVKVKILKLLTSCLGTFSGISQSLWPLYIQMDILKTRFLLVMRWGSLSQIFCSWPFKLLKIGISEIDPSSISHILRPINHLRIVNPHDIDDSTVVRAAGYKNKFIKKAQQQQQKKTTTTTNKQTKKQKQNKNKQANSDEPCMHELSICQMQMI